MKQGKIFSHFGALTAVFATLSLSACVMPDIRPVSEAKPAAESRQATVKRSGFACCNLHYNGDWISDANLAHLPFIAAGTPIKVWKIEANRASVEIGGKMMWLGLDNGRKQQGIEQWVNKLVVLDDPRTRIARYPAIVRNAIANGQLVNGMTREQVMTAVGHPPSDDNLNPDAPYWRYGWNSTAPYYVYWSNNGTVIKIDGPAETVGRVTYKGK